MALPQHAPKLGTKTVETLLKELETKILEADVKRMAAGGRPSPKNKTYVQALQEAREMLQDTRNIGGPVHKLNQGQQGTLIKMQPTYTPDSRSAGHAG